MIQIAALTCSSPILGTLLNAFKQIVQIAHIVVPIVLMVSLALKIGKMSITPDDKKGLKKILNSVLAAVIVFFIPMFIDLVMNAMGENFSVSSCWKSLSVPTGTPTYKEPYKTNRNPFITDPSEYEEGKQEEDYQGSSTGGGSGEHVGTASLSMKGIVWDSSNVTRISNLTSTQLIAILNAHGGKARNFIPYAQTLIATERKYSVNVFFLIGIEALESGWITSNISKNCNNLGGVRATSSHPSHGCGSNSGGGFAYFSSPNEFIDYHGSMLHKSYLTPGGKYYEGTSPYDVVIHYNNGSQSWANSVIKIGNSLFAHVSSTV